MFKFFIGILVCLLAGSEISVRTAFAQTQKLKLIKDIRINGNKNFKKRDVYDLIKTHRGDFYSENALREDIQAILASGNYEDAEIETEDLPKGIRVIFKVKEKPMVKKIDFTGAKNLSKSKMKEEITTKLKEGFDTVKMQADVKKIVSLYGEKGYPDASVEPFTTFDEEAGAVSINFVIKEGNRVLIENIVFEGLHAFKEKKIRKLIKTKRHKVYNSDTVKKDRESIEGFYKDNGYAKVEVREVKIAYNPERTKMTLTYPVVEGDRYVIGGFEFTGNTVYSTATLAKAVELKPGALFSQKKFDGTLNNIRELYWEKGHLYYKMDPRENVDQERQKINYTFNIDEGNIIYIDRIFIEGQKKTKEKVFLREMLLKPGDPFSVSKLRRSQEKIMNLGFIDDVKPDLEPASDPDKEDLVMEIVEGKPGSLSAGAGYSSTDGLVGQIQMSHANIFGLAQKLSIMWEFGSRRQNYEVSWTDPWILDKPVSLGLDVYNTRRLLPFASGSGTDYTETRQGGSVRIGPRFSDIYTLNFTYTLNKVRISDVSLAFINQVPQTTSLNSFLTTELVRDSRDYWFDPTRGNRNSVSETVYGGPVLQGDTNMTKTIFSTSWFWTLFRVAENYPFVFSINGRFGGVQEFPPSDTVPIFERFYVGGADSVRGYQTRGEIGPLDGGRVFTVVNAEYRVPLYAENKKRILQLVLFADVGGAWRSSHDVLLQTGQSQDNSQNEKYMKSSVGFGMRITTPVFPIRLDWGYGLNHRAGEDISQIHFTLGNLF